MLCEWVRQMQDADDKACSNAEERHTNGMGASRYALPDGEQNKRPSEESRYCEPCEVFKR
jgi:hypothetical protein